MKASIPSTSGRSALALFYLDLFTPEEIAQLLKMKLEELGATLAEARTRLQESLDGAKPPVA
jgi:DNA-directed RNA polymerase specialized sigma24 family protein